MTSLQLEHPARPVEHRGRACAERSTRSVSSPRRTGIVSEAVVARYIRDLTAHGHRAHSATQRARSVTV